jgi:outer membrane protein assembly factor BamD
MLFRITIIIIFVLIISCSKKEAIYTPTEIIDPYKVYIEGFEAFKKNDFFFASKKFSEAELNFTVPEFAAKSALMSSFSLYGINFFSEAEENLMRYIKTYPADKNIIYAQYLLAIIYFEQIEDEKKDLEPLIKAKSKINFFLNKYPNTEYAADLKFKKDLIQNQLAAKELYIAKFYISVKKWIPAINRLKKIVTDYEKTIFIEEALYRLVEIHYHLGIDNEAIKYSSLLGYNYNSSEWYKKSYKIFNKEYEIINDQNKFNKDSVNKKKFLEKIKKFF